MKRERKVRVEPFNFSTKQNTNLALEQHKQQHTSLSLKCCFLFSLHDTDLRELERCTIFFSSLVGHRLRRLSNVNPRFSFLLQLLCCIGCSPHLEELLLCCLSSFPFHPPLVFRRRCLLHFSRLDVFLLLSFAVCLSFVHSLTHISSGPAVKGTFPSPPPSFHSVHFLIPFLIRLEHKSRKDG